MFQILWITSECEWTRICVCVCMFVWFLYKALFTLAFLFSRRQLHFPSSCSLTLYYRCGYCCNISFCLMFQGHFKYSVFFSASVHLGVYFTFACVLCILNVLAKILSTHVQTSVFVLLCVLKGIIHTEYWSVSQQIWPAWPRLRSVLCSLPSHVFPHTFCLWKCRANSCKFNFVKFIKYKKGISNVKALVNLPLNPCAISMLMCTMTSCSFTH